MARTCCPECKSSDELSIELKRSFELKWSDRHNEFELGASVNNYSAPYFGDDNEVTCACGWSGRFDQLKPVTEKYRVVLILDVNVEEYGPIGDWDWRNKLDLQPHEAVSVDGVNKL